MQLIILKIFIFFIFFLERQGYKSEGAADNFKMSVFFMGGEGEKFGVVLKMAIFQIRVSGFEFHLHLRFQPPFLGHGR